MRKFLLLGVLLLIIGVFWQRHSATASSSIAAPKRAVIHKVVAPNPCAANQLPQLVLVSIDKRHLWACAANHQVYDSAVVTGMQQLPADLTPTGTYHIFAKHTDLHLRGADSTGSWDDHVYYWLPFLTNQYGQYGFHDATWRSASEFGHIDPNSAQGSHGCVELPLATAKWLYNWAQIGTTVTIE